MNALTADFTTLANRADATMQEILSAFTGNPDDAGEFCAYFTIHRDEYNGALVGCEADLIGAAIFDDWGDVLEVLTPDDCAERFGVKAVASWREDQAEYAIESYDGKVRIGE